MLDPATEVEQPRPPIGGSSELSSSSAVRLDWLKTNYPTGRKVCKGCGWRLLMDFPVARRNYLGHPTSLHSRCTTCRNLQRRVREGRIPWDEYVRLRRPEGYHRKLTKTEINKRVRAKRKLDPKRMDLYREYHRMYYHIKRGGKGSNRIDNRAFKVEMIRVDAVPFLEWWDDLPVKPPITDNQDRRIRDWRKSGVIQLAALDRLLFDIGREEMLPILYSE